MKHKVNGHDGLYKDPSSGVIVNRSTNDRERYRIAKMNALKQVESREEIDEMKKDISEIKSLLHQLLRK